MTPLIYKVDTADLVSLSNFDGGGSAPVDLETEQLISEIEQLTSRALQETNQWRITGIEDNSNRDVIANNNSWPATN